MSSLRETGEQAAWEACSSRSTSPSRSAAFFFFFFPFLPPLRGEKLFSLSPFFFFPHPPSLSYLLPVSPEPGGELGLGLLDGVGEGVVPAVLAVEGPVGLEIGAERERDGERGERER
jgi:hypothetical protein